ncbi:MarR family winged helix-turn-helix transcriptional regulator [Raoultibacter phocaeensis]|uniref:MarR family winged helix-turn-helix transcriptional regulator n=1 Tax=Raoultibacter phocaeensis TaxID=2479841 RepID=UPI0015D5CB23|nr:MarR family transcriptional regulator [Raoultibacter phocaeensis]
MEELLALKADIDAMLRAKYGPLTGREYLVLLAVAARKGHATLTDIARANRCSTQATKAFVERLEARGYLVVSEPDIGDKRTIDIALTEAGERVVKSCPLDTGQEEHGVEVPAQAQEAVSSAVHFFHEWGSVDESEHRTFEYF